MIEFGNDIPLDLAQAAHGGTSFVPERRGQQERNEYADTLRSDYAELSALADTPEKQAQLVEEFDRYRAGYRKRSLALLHSRSRCLSPMITGGARFPVERNRKRNEIAHRRLEELLDFRTRALAAIRKALQPELRPIMASDADATDRLREKIAQAEALQERMKAANAAIRKHAKTGQEAQVKALVDLGFEIRRACELLKPDFCGRIGFPGYELTNNNANIRRMKERVVGIEKAQATPDTVQEGKAARLEDCPAENRIRLFFPGKPGAEVRDRLKANGFRWAPSLGCWQAFRNPRALQTAAEVAEAGPRPGSLRWWATERGFKVFIRCGRVYAWHTGGASAQVADVDNGRWMEHHDIAAAPWRQIDLTPEQFHNFEAAAADCYCYRGVDRCDFCTSMRTPDGAPSSNGSAFYSESNEPPAVF